MFLGGVGGEGRREEGEGGGASLALYLFTLL